MKVLIFNLLILLSFPSFLQLMCKTTTNEQKKSIKTCFHKNKQISTTEVWDKDKRQGKIIGFSNTGTKLFEFYLRTFGGHASAHLSYYPNGQVSKVEYSSAPDGGIQWYQETLKMDENGNIIDKMVQEHPFQLYTKPFEFEHQTNPEIKPYEVPEKKPEVIACATPYLTFYKVKNATNKKISFDLIPQKNNLVQLQKKSLEIDENEFIVADSIFLANQFLDENHGYKIELNVTPKQAKKYEVLKLETIKEKERIIYQWVIIRK